MTKSFHQYVLIRIFVVLAVFGLIGSSPTWAATTPSLGAAATYGVLSSTYTNTTITTIDGDVGFTTPPATPPLGVHPYYGIVPPYSTAGTDQGVALSALNAQGCDFNFGVATDLSTLLQPLVPGVYCISAAASIGTSGIVLSGAGTYIFRIDGTLDTTVNSAITLTGGASACDVFWTPNGATTFAANTIFKGTVIDDAGITVGANTVWEGRALAFGETVTTDTTTITNTCAPTPAALHVIKLVDNTSGGIAIATDFTLHVTLSGSDVAGSPGSGTLTPGSLYALYAGIYVVSETAHASYSATFTGDCSMTGSITLLAGEDKTCTIINTYMPPNGGGRTSSIVIDICPAGDRSGNPYDGVCAIAPLVNTGSVLITTNPPASSPTPSPVANNNNNTDSPSLRDAGNPLLTNPPHAPSSSLSLTPLVYGSTLTLPAELPRSGALVEEKSLPWSFVLAMSSIIVMMSSFVIVHRKRVM